MRLSTATKLACFLLLGQNTIAEGVPVATSFEVKARVPGGKWERIETYQPVLNEVNFTTGGSIKHNSSLAYFDFNSTVEIQARYLKDRVSKAVIRPYSLNLTPKKSGSIVTFTLNEPRDIIVQVNDDIFDVLHIFTNPPDTNFPSEGDKDVIYYGPGYHNLNSTLEVGSGKTLYVAGGAVVSAPDITVTNSSDVTVRGRGLLYSPKGNSLQVYRSKNVLIERLVGINFLPRAYESKDVTFSHWRDFSAVQWGDGMDVYCCENVLIDSVFLRNSDDCIAVYAHRDEWYGNSTNITIQNSILWADVAHPINIGTHGNTQDPETIAGLTIRNIDILDQREGQVDYQGTIALNPGDGNLIQDVVIDDVRVEDIRVGQLLNFRVMYNTKYNTSPGRGIKDVLVRDLKYTGTKASMSLFVGYDEERTISNVTFENLVINGKVISDDMQKPGWYRTTDFIPAYANEHVHNMTFTST
ncbi:tat pathway signal sequence domain-containing protein [Fusarium pseudoanthophilum]|uniref:Tat pathway signal sequence domain-containing protein n=1 Tax=Fusarium pseudoanthophilum TaxID=48495 RepID=A0A8H5NS59_9HYPO|nr:tat pathway signal sequence domain-containing protein [Fusarium pseudoanthophilum]